MPVARYPAPVRRRRAPGTADPNEVVAIFVPRPISGDPNEFNFRIVSLLVFGRDFADILWWFLGHDHTWRWVGGRRRGERLVNRASRERFDVLVEFELSGSGTNVVWRGCQGVGGRSRLAALRWRNGLGVSRTNGEEENRTERQTRRRDARCSVNEVV